eukprot:m.11844 g.11844  ORF g.11844 m.11844 type:complete len:394 (+) comp5968_c0_seq1:177-1358(+)
MLGDGIHRVFRCGKCNKSLCFRCNQTIGASPDCSLDICRKPLSDRWIPSKDKVRTFELLNSRRAEERTTPLEDQKRRDVTGRVRNDMDDAVQGGHVAAEGHEDPRQRNKNLDGRWQDSSRRDERSCTWSEWLKGKQPSRHPAGFLALPNRWGVSCHLDASLEALAGCNLIVGGNLSFTGSEACMLVYDLVVERDAEHAVGRRDRLMDLLNIATAAPARKTMRTLVDILNNISASNPLFGFDLAFTSENETHQHLGPMPYLVLTEIFDGRTAIDEHIHASLESVGQTMAAPRPFLLVVTAQSYRSQHYLEEITLSIAPSDRKERYRYRLQSIVCTDAYQSHHWICARKDDAGSWWCVNQSKACPFGSFADLATHLDGARVDAWLFSFHSCETAP